MPIQVIQTRDDLHVGHQFPTWTKEAETDFCKHGQDKHYLDREIGLASLDGDWMEGCLGNVGFYIYWYHEYVDGKNRAILMIQVHSHSQAKQGESET